MQPGQIVANRFVVEHLAGQGGMGAVYRAIDRVGGEPVALKVLAPLADATRFAQEIRTLSELAHPSIVRFVAHGVDDGAPFLAMQWIDGEDLAARIARGPLPVADCVAIASRLADALGFAHSHGVVHRDVKPSNVLLPAGNPTDARLLDFGIARSRAGAAGLTRSGALLGTPGYMAPEQASQAQSVGARADVFALGCVLFECVTGEPAFSGDNVMAVLAKILFEDARRMSDVSANVPHALDDLVARLLSKDPADRPSDGSAVLQALERLEADATTSPTRRAAPALGVAEQRFVTVILAGAESPSNVGALETLAESDAMQTLQRLRAVLAPLDARVAALLDGTVACVLSGLPSALDQATHAARSALRLRAERPDVPIAVASGRALIAGRLPLGEAIDRAARLVRLGSRANTSVPIRLDELTAGLLGGDFEVGGDEASLILVGARDGSDAPRTLLGRPTPCVGRDKELAFVNGTFDECVGESVSRAVLVTGPPGAGKSRVRHEITASLAPRAEIWLARGDPLAAGSPLGMLSRLLRRALGVLDGEPDAVRVQKIRARIARNVRDADPVQVAAFVGEIAGAPFPDDSLPTLRAARADPFLMGEQTRAAWLELVLAETAVCPLVLVLEDIHWGDRSSVDYVHAALRRLAERPFLVLAFARPEVHETFPSLWADRDVQEIKLGAIASKSAERLVRASLGDDVDPTTVRRIIDRAAGNAFYLEELIRAYADGHTDQLPASVVAMAQARLEGLDAEDRRILRAAAIVGEVFWRGALGALLGTTPDGALDGRLNALVDRELLGRSSAARFVGEREWSFRHALVREAAYAGLTDADRALGHRLAGQWLEAAGEIDPMTLAQHFERGSVIDRATEWYARAAEQALEGNDFDSAIVRAEHGIACGAVGEVLGILRLVQTSVHDWRGDNAETVRSGRDAMARLGKGSARWHRAAASVAVASRRLGDRAALADLGRELLDVVPAAGSEGVALACSARVALQLSVTGWFDIARALLDRLQARGDDLVATEPIAWAWLGAAEGIFELFEGDPSRLLRDGNALIAATESSGDLASACNIRFFVAVAAQTAGVLDRSEVTFREAIALAARYGLWTLYTISRKELGATLLAMGRVDEALPLAIATLDETRRQGDRFQEATGHEILASAYLQTGALDDAEREAREAVDMMDAAPTFRSRALSTLSGILLARGSPKEALDVARQGEVARQAAPTARWGDGWVGLALAEAYEACGQREEARREIESAAERVIAAQRKFSDAALAKPFMELPAHRRLIARMAEWSRATE